ncbi:alpha-ketoglutarate-dependent dioxygenase AlkB [Psychrobacter sanguinis]|uniref:alpha-ketoglutarate-dependent dioxygenase AlkB family protein n=1 Tax=Psychrobacter sanguinis TaxID=861445 RepID=UPI002A752EC0|nr:alpha-ketoglutarate-dependent dioxygenase AlkB [Psychrobacter sanguinis]MDY3306755.1 alpha-ketoglutarate-dependent dioxygenase AlkB [Psychrobacter sanguinis]
MMDLFSQQANEVSFTLPKNCPEIYYEFNEQLNGFEIYVPNGKLFYSPNFFNQKISNRSIEYFLENDCSYPTNTDWASVSIEDFEKIVFNNIHWKQEYINLYGLKPIPRLTAWYGDEGKLYKYSGILQHPYPWNKALLYIKEQVEAVAGTEFNSVLLNWYRDGNDYLSWHADDESELGINPIIASVSFGATRDFKLRNNDNHNQKLTIPLSNGSLMIMSDQLQHYWQHTLPKRKRVKDSRFNLTFRVVY